MGEIQNAKEFQDEKKWCVYIHTNKINGKKYVGITSKNPPEKRWGKHGSRYKDNVYFWNAIQKYGWDNFKHEVILKNETLDFANKAEKCLIKTYNCRAPHGYNLTDGGDGTPGHILSDESKKKMIESIKMGYELGRKPWNYGIPMSDEQKEKMRQVSIGRIISEDTRKKLSDIKKGKPPNNKGKPMSEEAKKKLSNALKWHPTSMETRNKIGDANRGRYIGMNHPKHRPIYCLELNEIFWGAKEVNEKYKFSASNIGLCCRGERNYAHKHPVTGEILHWYYCDDAIKHGHITQIQLDHYLNSLKQNNNTKLL